MLWRAYYSQNYASLILESFGVQTSRARYSNFHAVPTCKSSLYSYYDSQLFNENSKYVVYSTYSSIILKSNIGLTYGLAVNVIAISQLLGKALTIIGKRMG